MASTEPETSIGPMLPKLAFTRWHVVARQAGLLHDLTEALRWTGSLRNGDALALEILDGVYVGFVADQDAVAVAAGGVHRIGLERQTRGPGHNRELHATARPVRLTGSQRLIGLHTGSERHDFNIEAVLGEESLLDPDVKRRLRPGGEDAEPNFQRFLRASVCREEQRTQQHGHRRTLG